MSASFLHVYMVIPLSGRPGLNERHLPTPDIKNYALLPLTIVDITRAQQLLPALTGRHTSGVQHEPAKRVPAPHPAYTAAHVKGLAGWWWWTVLAT